MHYFMGLYLFPANAPSTPLRSVILALYINKIESVFFFQGIPTHDATGEPISAKQVKKLKKLYQQQEKLYNNLGPGANKQ